MDGFFPQSEDKMRVNERDSAIKENEKAMIKRLSDIRPCLKIVRTPIEGSFSATGRTSNYQTRPKSHKVLRSAQEKPLAE